MKTTLILLSLTAGALAVACGNARTPEMYRDDTQKVLDSKTADIKACYDGILKGTPGVGGKVTVKFEVEEDTGKIKNVIVDQPNTTAPAPVGACIQHALAGLVVAPPDSHLGQAAFVYDFSQPPAPAVPSPPPAAPKT